MWRGQTMDDRSAERREQLLDVGFELMGESGVSAVTVRAVCRSAQLSSRYFYETFSNREDFMVAIYDRVEANLLTRLLAVGGRGRGNPVRMALEECALYFEEDPRRARILLREPLADDTLRTHGAGRAPAFIQAVAPALDTGAERLAPRNADELAVFSAALSGALISLYLEWVDRRLTIDRETLAATATDLVAAIARASRHAE